MFISSCLGASDVLRNKMPCEYRNRKFSRYHAKPINLLLRQRELGFSSSFLHQQQCRTRNGNGSSSDFELLRSLYCTEDACLEGSIVCSVEMDVNQLALHCQTNYDLESYCGL